MDLDKHRDEILKALRGRTELRDESAAWRTIERAVLAVADGQDGDRKARIEQYVYELCLIYAHQTGAMPGFTNSESETRFERFAHSIPVPADLKLTRNYLKACIRRVDAKRNPQFARDLEMRGGQSAAG
ncbi:MAG: hypothetical protein J0I19_03925 [Alphaproteobacteria bacterium]|nr:hypothetical protein [Alphaproteobacteria bacterium]